MLANVQQATIKPVITAAVAPGTLVHTDEYSIYARLPAWGYRHKTVCHGRGGACKVVGWSRQAANYVISSLPFHRRGTHSITPAPHNFACSRAG